MSLYSNKKQAIADTAAQTSIHHRRIIWLECWRAHKHIQRVASPFITLRGALTRGNPFIPRCYLFAIDETLFCSLSLALFCASSSLLQLPRWSARAHSLVDFLHTLRINICFAAFSQTRELREINLLSVPRAVFAINLPTGIFESRYLYVESINVNFTPISLSIYCFVSVSALTVYKLPKYLAILAV